MRKTSKSRPKLRKLNLHIKFSSDSNLHVEMFKYSKANTGNLLMESSSAGKVIRNEFKDMMKTNVLFKNMKDYSITIFKVIPFNIKIYA